MKQESKVSNMALGEVSTLSRDAKFIRFEGTNEDLFWRVYGDVANPDCQIIVPPTHQVVYIKDGVLQDVLEGGMHKVFETVKKGFLGIGRKMDAVAVDLIFMNRTIKFNAHWGTRNPIYARDPITDIPVTIRGNGEFEVGIDNPKKFYLEIVGTEKVFNLDNLRERLQVRLLNEIEPVISKAMHDLFLSYADITMHKKELGQAILPEVNRMFVEDCGLKIYSFTIDVLSAADEEIEIIEREIAERKRELKEKADAKEIAAELERLDDKDWNRNLILRNLESADREKYLEVMKILAASGKSKIYVGLGNPEPSSSNYGHGGVGVACPNCGNPVPAGSAFCPTCGAKMGPQKQFCAACGKEMPAGAAFCPHCGHKN